MALQRESQFAELLRAVGHDRIEVQRDTMPAGKESEEERRAAFDSFKYMLPPSPTHSTYAWCAQFVEVRVDEDYGTVRVAAWSERSIAADFTIPGSPQANGRAA